MSSSKSASVSSSSKDRDADDKKRRKPGLSESSQTQQQKTTSSNNSSASAHKEDVYTNVVRFEAQESEHRPADSDSNLFHDTFSDLRTLFAEIAQQQLKAVKLSASGSSGGAEKIRAELNEKRIECSYMFVLMKKLNRMDKIRLRSGRDALHKEKLSVDSNRLQLQNLLYEAEHLRKEVQRCMQFKSHDEQIELVDEDQFYANAPENISRPEKTRDDEHARRLARLDWELQQRKELAALCEQLQQQKELAAKHIESKTQCLESLAPRLDALLKATRPVQEALNMHIEDEWKVHKIARLLPPPLYMAYANLSAYAEACEPELSVTIEGDEFEAKQLNGDTIDDDPPSASQSDKSSSLAQDEDDAMESDNEDEDPRPSKKSHHHRRQPKTAHLDYRREHLFKPHPLNITFSIKSQSTGGSSPNAGSTLCVTLHYLMTLNLITVTVSLQFDGAAVQQPTTNSEVIAPATILNSLTAGDLGIESPNPKTFFQLNELEIDSNTFASLLASKDLGKPYRWAQSMCGLEFVSNNNNNNNNTCGVSLEITHVAVPQIVRQIRQRWQNRLELLSHIEPLIQCKQPTINSNTSAGLSKWTSITWNEYSEQLATKRFIDMNVVNQEDLFYNVVIVRGTTARLECAVRLSANHPSNMPLWAVTLHRKANFVLHTSQTNCIVREIESWVNDTSLAAVDQVLEQQLHRAQSCLDIYLETEANSAEFKQEKTFLRAFRTRARSRPFKEIQAGASTVYTQVV